MMYKALRTFSGIISMSKGQIREISDKTIINDLIKAGYIEAVQPAKKGDKTNGKNNSGRA